MLLNALIRFLFKSHKLKDVRISLKKIDKFNKNLFGNFSNFKTDSRQTFQTAQRYFPIKRIGQPLIDKQIFIHNLLLYETSFVAF
jgi:hypothetical protein